MITIVVAVDNHHLDELQTSLPSWIKYKEFNKYPFLVIYDDSQLQLDDVRFDIFKNINVSYIPVQKGNYNSQREKMLTALTVLPGKHVKTDWYLKIDTDCIATNYDKWFDESWLNKKYVFITNKWNSTKPANAIELLDNWSANKFDNRYEKLNLPYNKNDKSIK